MIIETTPLKDLHIIHPKIIEDNRGYFFESFNQAKFENNGLNYTWKQDNESKSARRVIRGLHYQLNPHAQAKLVRVLAGKIFDVAVDIRKKSSTFGKWFGVELSSENKTQLLIPEGFAHGFSVLSEVAVVFYKCNELYNPHLERGIHFKDPTLNIEWNITVEKAIISPKDQILPSLYKSEKNF